MQLETRTPSGKLWLTRSPPRLSFPSPRAGLAVSSHLDRCCRFSVLNSSCRIATELVRAPHRSRIVRRIRLKYAVV
eukprot:3163114-Pyramimonas_sp.AAC.1